MSALPIILVLVALVLAGAFAAWGLTRFSGAGRAGQGEAARRAASDPLAVLQRAVDDGVAHIQRAKETLEDCRGLVSNAWRLVESSQQEKARLESRITAALAQGDDRQQAKAYALELAEVEGQLAAHQQELAKHEATYRTFAVEVEAGRQRVIEARRKAAELGIDLAQSQREKELAQFAAGLTPDTERLSGDVARAEASVQDEIDRNRAVGRVAADLAGAGQDPATADGAAREAAAEQILQRFPKPLGQP